MLAKDNVHGAKEATIATPDDVTSLLIALGEQQAPGNIDYGQSEAYFVSEEFDKEDAEPAPPPPPAVAADSMQVE